MALRPETRRVQIRRVGLSAAVFFGSLGIAGWHEASAEHQKSNTRSVIIDQAGALVMNNMTPAKQKHLLEAVDGPTTTTTLPVPTTNKPVDHSVATRRIVTPAKPVYAAYAGSNTQAMAEAGIPPSDFYYAGYIFSHESGYCATREEGYHGPCLSTPMDVYRAYGECQANPGTKMAGAGADWETNEITQMRWCNGYADERYGGWYPAYEHWLANRNW